MIIFPNSRKDVADRASTDVQAELPTSQPFLKKSYLRALIVGYAGRIYEFYKQLLELIKQLFPDTATGTYAQRWGNLVNINPNAATQSSGGIVMTGTAGTIIDAGEIFTVNSLQYTTNIAATLALQTVNVTLVRSGNVVTATSSAPHNLATNLEVTISGASPSDMNGTFVITVTSDTTFTYNATGANGTATGTITATYTGSPVTVTSIDYGADTTQASGTALQVQSPISGLNNLAYVQYDGISGGADAESDSSYQQRYLYRYQNLHALFNPAEIITTAKKVSGVTRVWVLPITPAVGMVTVYFTRDNDVSIIPSGSAVQTVYNQLLSILQAVTDPNDLIVLAPTPLTVNFTFTALSPNTNLMRQAITDNLTALFKEANDVGMNLLSDTYRCAIAQTIDASGAQIQSYTLSAPSGDIVVGAGQLPILGTITFP